MIFDREIHVAGGVPMKSYEHREAQNSFDHQKRLTWAGVMIFGRVSFFGDLRVESASAGEP